MGKLSAPPEHTATLKELMNAPLPDLEAHRAAIERRVAARRQLEDLQLEKQLKVKNERFDV